MLDGAAKAMVWGALPGVTHRAGGLVWLGGGTGPLRAASAHALAPSDLSKHETLLSSFSQGERHAKRAKKG